MAGAKTVIDVSQFNGTVDWAEVKAGGMDAAIIRAGYRGYGSAGTLCTDSFFRANIEGAISAGIPVGVYWLSQAVSDAEALAEAKYLCNLLSPYKITYPVYLDSEWAEPNGKGRADRLTRARRTQYGLTLCRALRDCGYTAGLYCSESWYLYGVDGAAFASEGLEIWIAKYASVKPSMACNAWQYTSTARVNGIGGYADVSEFYVDYADAGNVAAVQQRFGLSDSTMAYLAAYRYGADLLAKLAGGRTEEPESLRQQVQRRFALSDATMDYLESWTWGADLLKKLAEAE